MYTNYFIFLCYNFTTLLDASLFDFETGGNQLLRAWELYFGETPDIWKPRRYQAMQFSSSNASNSDSNHTNSNPSNSNSYYLMNHELNETKKEDELKLELEKGYVKSSNGMELDSDEESTTITKRITTSSGKIVDKKINIMKMVRTQKKTIFLIFFFPEKFH